MSSSNCENKLAIDHRPPYWYFISDPFHTLFYDVTVITSILSNSLLILIIRTTKTPKTDNYRYLLLCFAIGDMISSISHSLTSPIVHLTSHGFFFFPKSANSLKSEGALLGKTVCLAYIFMYYQTFNILTFHFIYRYRIIAQSLDSSLFTELYSVNTSDPQIGYIAVEYRRFNKETGKEEWHANSMISFSICISLFSLSGGVMIVCSYCITVALRSIPASTAKRLQQKMLFRALLIQTLIPCIFSYIPLFTAWFFPLTGIALGPFGNFLIMSSTLFPSVDAMLIMFFIPAYRQSISKLIQFAIGRNEMAPVTSYSLSKQ